MLTKQKIYVMTYGSNAYKKSTERFREEIEDFGEFDEILIYTDDDMTDEYYNVSNQSKVSKQSKGDFNIARGFPRIILINKFLPVKRYIITILSVC